MPRIRGHSAVQAVSRGEGRPRTHQIGVAPRMEPPLGKGCCHCVNRALGVCEATHSALPENSLMRSFTTLPNAAAGRVRQNRTTSNCGKVQPRHSAPLQLHKPHSSRESRELGVDFAETQISNWTLRSSYRLASPACLARMFPPQQHEEQPMSLALDLHLLSPCATSIRGGVGRGHSIAVPSQPEREYRQRARTGSDASDWLPSNFASLREDFRARAVAGHPRPVARPRTLTTDLRQRSISLNIRKAIA